MTAKERAALCRLLVKIDDNSKFCSKIGLIDATTVKAQNKQKKVRRTAH